MDLVVALGVLGLREAALDGPAAARTVRSAYLSRIREVHPDRNRAHDATDLTRTANEAYEVVIGLLADRRPITAAVDHEPTSGATVPTTRNHVVTMLDDDTIAVEAPREEALMAVIEVASDLGEITFLDPGLAMVQVVIEFLDAPTAQILMTLQGRGDLTTEIMCCVEPFDGSGVPRTRPVVELLAAAIEALSC